MINSVAKLCPLLQPVSLYSLPNTPSLIDLDWDENNIENGKVHIHTISCLIRCVCSLQQSRFLSNFNECCLSQRWGEVLHHPILIPGAASLSWIPVVAMAVCVWSTKTALQVFCLYLEIALMGFLFKEYAKLKGEKL